MAGALSGADGQSGGSEDRPLELQPGPQDSMSSSNRLLSCPANAAKHFRNDYGQEPEISSPWQVALGKSHPCPEPRFLQLYEKDG